MSSAVRNGCKDVQDSVEASLALGEVVPDSIAARTLSRYTRAVSFPANSSGGSSPSGNTPGPDTAVGGVSLEAGTFGVPFTRHAFLKGNPPGFGSRYVECAS
jgi:hypothetical protein